MCSFSLLRNWSKLFYLFQNRLIDLLTSKDSCVITTNIKCCFTKKKGFGFWEGFWTANPFFSGLRMYFHRLWYLLWSDYCLLHLNHVSLGFNVYIYFSSFHNGLKYPCSLKLVSILRVILRKVVMKCKIVMFHNCLGSFSHQVSNIQST